MIKLYHGSQFLPSTFHQEGHQGPRTEQHGIQIHLLILLPQWSKARVFLQGCWRGNDPMACRNEHPPLLPANHDVPTRKQQPYSSEQLIHIPTRPLFPLQPVSYLFQSVQMSQQMVTIMFKCWVPNFLHKGISTILTYLKGNAFIPWW